MVHPEKDRNHTEDLLRALVDVPASARRLYRRGGWEGLEPNVLQMLVALHIESGLTVTQLVNWLALGQGTVSTGLAQLRDRGLVREEVDPDDERRRRQLITRSGRAVVRRFAREAGTRAAAAPGLPVTARL